MVYVSLLPRSFSQQHDHRYQKRSTRQRKKTALNKKANKKQQSISVAGNGDVLIVYKLIASYQSKIIYINK